MEKRDIIVLGNVVNQIQNGGLSVTDYTFPLKEALNNLRSVDDDMYDIDEVRELKESIVAALRVKLSGLDVSVDTDNMVHLYSICIGGRYDVLQSAVESELSDRDKQKYYYRQVRDVEPIELPEDENQVYLTAVKRNMSDIVYYILSNIDREYRGMPISDNNGGSITYGNLFNLYGDFRRGAAESIATNIRLGAYRNTI